MSVDLSRSNPCSRVDDQTAAQAKPSKSSAAERGGERGRRLEEDAGLRGFVCFCVVLKTENAAACWSTRGNDPTEREGRLATHGEEGATARARAPGMRGRTRVGGGEALPAFTATRERATLTQAG